MNTDQFKVGQKVWTTVNACDKSQRMANGIITAVHSGYCDVDIMSLHGGSDWIVPYPNTSLELIEEVETNIGKRWLAGTNHHPKSIELYKILAEIDLKYGDDHFCWKSGGDGDNGETLMYELDIHFEQLDQNE